MPSSPSRLLAALAIAAVAVVLASCTAAPDNTQNAPKPRPTTATEAPRDPVVDADGELFILDNDWSLYSGGDALIALAAENATLLGTVTTTGDAWAPQGTEAALSFLEKIGRDDVSVAQGQIYPLINTPARTHARTALYGGQHAWQGAFAASEDDPSTLAIPDPNHVAEPMSGWARSLAATEASAADYMIEQVHRYPGRVTIITTGPLTNVAAAIRQDPTFAAEARQIVIGGGNIEQMAPGEDDPGFNSSEGFNFRFDAEAAHIVLSAPWRSITVVGDATDSVIFDDALMERITSRDTPASQFIRKVGYVGYPIWDETTAAIAIDPSLIAASIELRMDVDLSEGPNYGATRIWADGDSPGLGEGLVHYVQAVDTDGVADLFVGAAQRKF